VATDHPAVLCEGVVKIYETDTSRVQAVRGVDLSITRGSIVAIVGPSGSGKSSLLDMVSGLIVPTAGRILIGGVDLAALGARRRRRARRSLMSYVQQRPSDNLLPYLTAVDQVAQVASHRGAEVSAAADMLNRLNLSHRHHHVPHELSGGEQQRLAFARAAVGSAVLVVADEPTAELDTKSAADVLDTVETLAGDGTTVLMATHDPRVIERAETILELRDGAIASLTTHGEVHAVIDSSGRMQLPPDIRSRFPTGTARLRWDETGDHLRVERP